MHPGYYRRDCVNAITSQMKSTKNIYKDISYDFSHRRLNYYRMCVSGFKMLNPDEIEIKKWKNRLPVVQFERFYETCKIYQKLTINEIVSEELCRTMHNSEHLGEVYKSLILLGNMKFTYKKNKSLVPETTRIIEDLGIYLMYAGELFLAATELPSVSFYASMYDGGRNHISMRATGLETPQYMQFSDWGAKCPPHPMRTMMIITNPERFEYIVFPRMEKLVSERRKLIVDQK